MVIAIFAGMRYCHIHKTRCYPNKCPKCVIKKLKKQVLPFIHFGKLPLDIQEIIYEKTITIQNRDKLKFCIDELSQLFKLSTDDGVDYKIISLKHIFYEFNVGKVIDEIQDNCVITTVKYDEEYYKELDYIYDCIYFSVVAPDNDIDLVYMIKPNRENFVKYDYVDNEAYFNSEEFEEDDYVSFKKQKICCMSYADANLYDIVPENFGCYDFTDV